MKVLIIASNNSGKSSFVIQQANSIINKGIEVEYYWIKGKGLLGYLKNLIPLRKKIRSCNCDIVHAHYGLSGLLACLQKIKPVVVTYHGCDINIKRNRILSFFSILLSNKNIFVHKDLINKISIINSSYPIIPCGVDLNQFHYIDKVEARKKMNFRNKNKYILFSSSFNNPVKNYNLAQNAIKLLDEKIELIELDGYTAEEVNILLNAVDLLLVTSKRETGPMIIKEAMAVGCPVVSSEVGDVKKLINGIENSYIISTSDPVDFSNSIKKCLNTDIRYKGKKRILDLGFSSDQIADKIITIYNEVI